LITAACAIILSGTLEASGDLAANSSIANAASTRRALRGGGAADATSLSSGTLDTASLIELAAENDAPIESVLWVLLSAGVLTISAFVATTLFLPSETMSVFMLSMTRMFKNDMIVFLILFTYFMVVFYAALYILYPRSGDGYIPTIPAFNNWYEAAKAQMEVALVGNPTPINLNPELLGALGTAEQVTFGIFMILYFFYVLISLILLLNLFIAMLSNTFEATKVEAVLQSRTSFATGILKLELICQSFGMDTKVGERVGDKYVFNFKSVAKNSEGGGTGGGTDPFEVPDEGGALARI